MNTVRIILTSLALVGLVACGAPTRAGSTTGYNPGASAPTSPAVPPQRSGPATTFDDGTWVVGEDIVPGTYKSTGAKEGFFEFCAVSTYANDTASGNVLGFDTANANEPIRIKVAGKVKSVKASGCDTFTKVG